MSYQKYDQKFKEEAVKLVTEQGLSHHAAAAELGIPSTTLGNWLYKRKGKKSFTSEGVESSEQSRVRQLEKDVRILKMERDILKKATAFFARENQ